MHVVPEVAAHGLAVASGIALGSDAPNVGVSTVPFSIAGLGVVLVYAAVLWLPGVLLGWLAGLRGWTLTAAGPLLGYAVAGLAGPAFGALGLRWSPTKAGLLVAALALIMAAVIGRNRFRTALRRTPARSGPGTATRPAMRATQPRSTLAQPEAGWTRPVQLGVGAALAAIAACGTAVIWAGVGRLSAVPQDWDAVFHANGIRWIADTGDSSLYGMGRVNWFENDVQIFYPNAYHLLGALVFRLTGTDIPTVLNAHTALLPGMGALVIVALVRRCGGRAALAVIAAGCAVAATPFYDMLWRGPLLPFATGVALMPLATVLMLDLLDGSGWRCRLRCGVLFALAMVGLICLNPSVLFSAVLFALPALVQRWAEQPRRLGRDLLALAGAGLAAVALAVPQLLGSLASTSGGGAVDWPADLDLGEALAQLLTFSHVGAHPEWLLAGAGALGILWFRRLGGLRWIVGTGVLFGTLFVLTAVSDADWVNAVTRPWWNDRWRFIALCVVPFAILAGHGLTELLHAVARRIPARGRPPVTAPAAAALVAVLLIGTYSGQNIGRMRMSAPNSPVVSDLEVQAMRVLPDFVPPGERVLNDRGDGSAWMFAIAGILPVAGHYNAGQIGPDADLLAGRFNEYDNDPAVRAAVARLGIRYVIVDRGYIRAGYHRQFGLMRLSRMYWLELVYSNPDAQIYRIRPLPPELP